MITDKSNGRLDEIKTFAKENNMLESCWILPCWIILYYCQKVILQWQMKDFYEIPLNTQMLQITLSEPLLNDTTCRGKMIPGIVLNRQMV